MRRRWPGRFTYDPVGGSRLEIDAKHEERLFPPTDESIPIVFGEANDGTALTLVDVAQVRTSLHLPDHMEITLRPRQVLIGAWCRTPRDLMFSQLTFRLSGLDQWLGRSGFVVDYRSPREGFSLDYTIPDSVVVADLPGLEVVADFHAGGLRLERPLVDVEVHQQARLRVVGAEPTPLDELIETARRIRNFFSFARRRNSRLLEASVRTEVSVRRRGERKVRHRETVNLTLLLNPEPLDDEKRVEPWDTLFTLDDGSRLKHAPLSVWLSRHQLLGPVYDLYLVALYQRRIYIHLQFISLAQALETLHTRKFPHYELPKAEYRDRLSTITNLLPPKDATWVREKLRHANIAPFRVAVEELVATLPATAQDPIGPAKQFARYVGWTRNYYTHWSESLETKAATGQDLVRLTWGLKVMLEALLLMEVGFSREAADTLLARNANVARDLLFAFENATSSES